MKKLLAIMLTLALLCALVLPALPVSADPPGKVPPGRPEYLPHGWHRLNPHVKTHVIRTDHVAKTSLVEATFSSVPETLDDNKTLIDTTWYRLIDASGQEWFESGVNTFKARAYGSRVSVEDGDGRLIVWDTSLSVGDTTYKGGEAYLSPGPLGGEFGSSLAWSYNGYKTGLFTRSGSVMRYLCLSNGSISELWYLPEDPNDTVVIKLSEKCEPNYEANIVWVEARDARGRPLRVTRNIKGVYVISASEFKGKKYPVVIDPTMNFEDGSIGELWAWGENYNTVHNASEANTVSFIGGAILGQDLWGDDYDVTRVPVYFDTSDLPDDADISVVKLGLWGGGWYPIYPNFNICVTSGMPTYPHNPPAAGDYALGHYVTSNTAGFNTASWVDWELNLVDVTHPEWLNKTGETKFCLMSDRDIDAIAPTGDEEVLIQYVELQVTYTVPATVPEVTTNAATLVEETGAKLHGYLDDDGTEACSVRFQYGTSTAYGHDTAWQSNKHTDDSFSSVIWGLSPGTTYHFRAQAMNSAGTGSGNDLTFVTVPEAPYNFTATAGDSTVALSWSKGDGAIKTMVRRSTTDYPTSPTDGTQTYFGTGVSHDDNTVVNGTKYYYSAWSEAGGVYSIAHVSDDATPKALADPTVTTNAATAVTTTTAKLNLNLDDLGGYATTDVWFQYYKGAGTWTDNETTPSEETSPGPYQKAIADLTTDTLYHCRAAATNTHGTSYGADVPFTTNAPSAPTMTTQAATGLQLRGATLNGVVTDDNDATVTAWFEWGLTTSYGHETPSISGLSSSDTFYYGLTGLEVNTTYHYRAIGQNSAGIGYGDDVEFVTTTPAAPTVRTDAASDVGANQALLNATVLTDGDVECEVRFQYGTTEAYGTNTEWVEGYTKDQTFSKLISSLTIGETYHFRAQVKNDGGTGDGDDATFTTAFGAPISFRAKAISSTTINLTWVKSGDITHIRYKRSGFPIDRADGDPIYNGPAEFTSISGLTAGITYYFRAWSWREGDVWADDYADDVATTQATLPAGEEEEPEMVTTPETPETWFAPPSGAAITKMPFYGPIVGLAESYGILEGSMWLVIAIVMTIMAAVLAFSTVRNAFVAVAMGGLVIASCSALGMIPLWFIFIYITLGGGMIYVTSRM